MHLGIQTSGTEALLVSGPVLSKSTKGKEVNVILKTPALIVTGFIMMSLSQGGNTSEEYRKKFETTEEVRVFDRVDRINIENLGFANIQVTKTDRPQVMVKVKKYALTIESKDAEKYWDYLKYWVEKENSTLKIKTEQKEKAPWEGTPYSAGFAIDVTLPDNKNISIATKSGELNIIGLKGHIEINNEFSIVKLKNLTGKIDYSTGYGTLSGEGIEISEVSRIATNYGYVNIEFKDIRQNLDISSRYGAIYITIPSHVSSQVDLVPGSGVIIVKSEGEKPEVFNTNKSITLGNGKHRVKLTTQFGVIHLQVQ